jgi:hypothetical protein
MMIQLQDSPLVLLSGKKRAARRAPIKAAKKAKHLAKITGKTSVINAKYSKRANVQKSKEEKRVGTNKARLNKKIQNLAPREKAIPDNIETPDDGSMPMPGGGGGGGGGNYAPSYGGDQDEEVYDESDQAEEESEEEGEPEYEEEQADPYGEEMQDGLSGIWGTALTAIKGAAKGAVNEFKGKAKAAITNKVQSVSPSYLQNENQALKNELAKYKDSQPYKMGGSALAGSLAGFIIGKILK